MTFATIVFAALTAFPGRLQLAERGVAKAEIVIAAEASQDVKDGAAELQRCLNGITG